MRFFVRLSYDGTNYHGWQSQPSASSVQQTIEQALGVLFRRDVPIVGAGRTDAGVHARLMVAHFDIDDSDTILQSQLFTLPGQLAYRLNHILPRDISIHSIEAVPPEMHARFSATARTYHYYLHTSRDPFLRHYSCEMHYPLNFDKMNEAAAHLLEVSDFASFCKSHTDVATTLCHVTEAEWREIAPSAYCFRITANRFLRNMVRAVVGTLIEVGRGRIGIERFRGIVASHKRTSAGESMPANALFLENIEYPEMPRTDSYRDGADAKQ